MKSNNKAVKPLKSTLLTSYSYDAKSYELTVTFRNGDELTYQDVRPDVFSKVFESGGSLGSKFLRNIAKTHKTSQA